MDISYCLSSVRVGVCVVWSPCWGERVTPQAGRRRPSACLLQRSPHRLPTRPRRLLFRRATAPTAGWPLLTMRLTPISATRSSVGTATITARAGVRRRLTADFQLSYASARKRSKITSRLSSAPSSGTFGSGCTSALIARTGMDGTAGLLDAAARIAIGGRASRAKASLKPARTRTRENGAASAVSNTRNACASSPRPQPPPTSPGSRRRPPPPLTLPLLGAHPLPCCHHHPRRCPHLRRRLRLLPSLQTTARAGGSPLRPARHGATSATRALALGTPIGGAPADAREQVTAGLQASRASAHKMSTTF